MSKEKNRNCMRRKGTPCLWPWSSKSNDYKFEHSDFISLLSTDPDE
jgi:hypothetical protein